MDPTIGLYFYGYIIAAYSVGQMLSSPLMGYVSQRTKSTKWPVVFGLVISIIGNSIYAILPTIADSGNSRYLMLFARFLVGIGCGIR